MIIWVFSIWGLTLLVWCNQNHNIWDNSQWTKQKISIKNTLWTWNNKKKLNIVKKENHTDHILTTWNTNVNKWITKKIILHPTLNSWNNILNLGIKINKNIPISPLPISNNEKICFPNVKWDNKTGAYKKSNSNNFCIKKNQLKQIKYWQKTNKNWVIHTWYIDKIFYKGWCFEKYIWWWAFTTKLFCYFKNKNLEYKTVYIFWDGGLSRAYNNLKFMLNNKIINYNLSCYEWNWFYMCNKIKYLDYIKKYITYKNSINISWFIYNLSYIKFNIWDNYTGSIYNNDYAVNVIYNNISWTNLSNTIYKYMFKNIKKTYQYISNTTQLFLVINIIIPSKQTNLPFNIILRYKIDPKYYYTGVMSSYFFYPILIGSFTKDYKKYNKLKSFKTTYWKLEKLWKWMNCKNLHKKNIFTCKKINSIIWMCYPDNETGLNCWDY